MDGNLRSDAMSNITDFCHAHGVAVWFEPTSVEKAVRPIINSLALRNITVISPNYDELLVMAQALTKEKLRHEMELRNQIESIRNASVQGE